MSIDSQDYPSYIIRSKYNAIKIIQFLLRQSMFVQFNAPSPRMFTNKRLKCGKKEMPFDMTSRKLRYSPLNILRIKSKSKRSKACPH